MKFNFYCQNSKRFVYFNLRKLIFNIIIVYMAINSKRITNSLTSLKLPFFYK